MHPILFEIWGIRIYSFGVMAAIGFLVAFVLLLRSNRRKGFHPESMSDLAFGLFISGFVGARALFVLLNWEQFQDSPLAMVQFQKGGLVAYGGVFLTVLFAALFTRFKSIPFWESADLIAPFGILAVAFGRIGCFLNGCCYGRPSRFFGTHPTQLYESTGLFLLFVGLTIVDLRPLKAGRLFGLTLGGYAFLRFGVEFFRGDQIPILLNLTLVQWTSVASLLVAVLIWRLRR